MSASAGQKIAFSDLSALATAANGKGSLSFNVSPMGLDGSGNPYGYQRFSGVAIAVVGTGYKCGDILSLGFGSAFSVEMVSPTGQVIGIRYVNPGAGVYTDSASSPAAASGGSGTGCQLKFSSFSQYGPTAAYDFGAMGLGLDFDPLLGNVTDYYFVDDGANYVVGDTLGLAEQPGTVMTVNTVDGGGKILTSTKTTGTTAINIPQNVRSMDATGGSGTGAKFGGVFTLAQKPLWLTELNRLRGDLDTVISTQGINPNVSGPWPSVFGSSFHYNAGEYTDGTGITPDLKFYYADPSPTVVTATLFQEGYMELSDETNPEAFYTSTTITSKIRIGGSLPVLLKARFTVAYGSGITGLSGSSTLPGFSGWAYQTAYYDSGGNPISNWCAVVNGTVSPGDYDITVSITGDVFAYAAIAVHSYPSISRPGATGTFECSATTNGSPAAVPGIHNSKTVYAISIPSNGSNNDSFGVWGWYATPVYGGSGYTIGWKSAGNYNLTFNVPGFVTYKTAPVSSLNTPLPSQMPWNLQRTKYGSTASVSENPALLGDLAPQSPTNTCRISNSYDQSLPVELQLEPPLWIASRYFTVGFNIMDSNGNFQKVTTAGTSASSHPAWPNVTGATVADGSVVWTCGKVIHGPDTWIASHTFNIGDTVVDANGNVQTQGSGWLAGHAYTVGQFVTDANNKTQQVTTAGTSGSSAPTWATVLSATTTDSTVVWTLVIAASSAVSGIVEPTWSTQLNGLTTDATAVWKLTKENNLVVPAVHRPLSVPRYPVYWQSETIAALKPPTSTSGLTIWGANNQWQRNTYHSPSYDPGWQQDNLALGWWIYSVSFNRIQPGSAVSVTIGCIRSGSFVAFGTYTTGQTVQVLWPVFTSDALVYQCAERVDIQAVAISSGGAGVSVGAAAAGYPVCASFVSDVTALLALIT